MEWARGRRQWQTTAGFGFGADPRVRERADGRSGWQCLNPAAVVAGAAWRCPSTHCGAPMASSGGSPSAVGELARACRCCAGPCLSLPSRPAMPALPYRTVPDSTYTRYLTVVTAPRATDVGSADWTGLGWAEEKWPAEQQHYLLGGCMPSSILLLCGRLRPARSILQSHQTPSHRSDTSTLCQPDRPPNLPASAASRAPPPSRQFVHPLSSPRARDQ